MILHKAETSRAEPNGTRGRHEGGGNSRRTKKEKIFFRSTTDLTGKCSREWHKSLVKLKRLNWELRTQQFASSSVGCSVGWWANKGASQLSRVFSSAPGLRADDTHITINLHNKATFLWGSGTTVCPATRLCWQRHKHHTFLLWMRTTISRETSQRKSERLHSRRIARALVCCWETRSKKLFTLSAGKVYPHVSSLVCGGTGPRSTQRNKGGILCVQERAQANRSRVRSRTREGNFYSMDGSDWQWLLWHDCYISLSSNKADILTSNKKLTSTSTWKNGPRTSNGPSLKWFSLLKM